MKRDGITLAKQTAFQVQENAVSLQLVNKMIEDKIRVVAKATMANEKSINNDFLKRMATDLNVDEINYYSPKGEIIYSNINDYVGWLPSKDHPVETFRLSDLDEFMENIRKDSESNNYNKYGYLRNINGTFIQIGIRSSY
jgi:methyl-accepting chemotaxis protein